MDSITKETLRSMGYVDTNTACVLCGRVPCGTFGSTLMRHKVRYIVFSLGGGCGTSAKWWRKEDLHKVPRKRTPPATPKAGFTPPKVPGKIVAGENNGGRLAHLLKNLELRVSMLEVSLGVEPPNG